jgi:hypothetical protein
MVSFFLLALFLYFRLYLVSVPFYPQASGAAPPDRSAVASSLPSVDVPHAAPLKPIGGNHPVIILLRLQIDCET